MMYYNTPVFIVEYYLLMFCKQYCICTTIALLISGKNAYFLTYVIYRRVDILVTSLDTSVVISTFKSGKILSVEAIYFLIACQLNRKFIVVFVSTRYIEIFFS